MTEDDICEIVRSQIGKTIQATLVEGGELEIRPVNVDGEGVVFVVGNAEYNPAAPYWLGFEEFVAVRPT